MGRRQLHPSTVWSLVVFLMVVSIYGYFHSSVFELRDIEVVGVKRVDPQAVLAASELQAGKNIFAVATRVAAEKIVKLPMVARATISRKLPDTLVIRVTERMPICLIPGPDGLYYLDREGIILSSVDTGRADLPVVTGVSFSGLKVGTSLEAPVKTILVEMYKHGDRIWNRLAEFNFADRENIVVFTTDLTEVHLGDGTSIERKFKVLARLLSEEPDAREIDLSFPDTPVIKKD